MFVKRALRWGWWMGFCLALSCKREAPAPKPIDETAPAFSSAPSDSAEDRIDDGAAPTQTRPPSSPHAAPALTEARVVSLVDDWLVAQNTVDFVSYSEQYARRFTGIKRAGKTQRTFDRKGWLDDRKGMFKPGLKVQVADLRVTLSGVTAQVRFEQTFTTDTFRDEGPKELLVIATDAGPRITREEMLESRVGAAKPVSYVRPDIWYVGDGRVYLGETVIGETQRGAILRLPEIGDTYVAERAVDVQRLSPEDRAWVGKKLFASSVDGEGCEVTITELRARVEVIPHFGQVQRWNGVHFGDPAQALPTPSPKEVTEEVWALGARAGAQLVGTLSRACDDARWATLTRPEVAARAAQNGGAYSSYLRGELAKHPNAEDVQYTFANSLPERSKLDWIDEAHFKSFTFDGVDSLRTAIASATVGEGCSDIRESLSVVYELDLRGAKPRVVRQRPLEGTWSGPVDVRAALDLDGDGQLEFISGPDDFERSISYWQPTPQGYDRTVLHAVDYQDCPC